MALVLPGILFLSTIMICIVARRMVEQKDLAVKDAKEVKQHVKELTTAGCDATNLITSNMTKTREDLIKYSFQGKFRADGGNRFFFITYGPPGSGKSGATILKKTIALESKAAGDINIEDPIQIVVDDLVKAWPGYVAEQKKCKNKNETQALYWAARGDQSKKAKPGEVQGVLGIDPLSYKIQDIAETEGYNVVMEITGRWVWQEWWEKHMNGVLRGERNYKAIMAYPAVTIQRLMERVRLRQQDTGQEAAPDIANLANLASSNLEKLMPYMDSIYLWDNNGEKGHEELILGWSQLSTKRANCNTLQKWLSNPAKKNEQSTLKDESQRTLEAWVANHSKGAVSVDGEKEVCNISEVGAAEK
eukprot:gnl/MRDRNA2_/MRDRNA2_35310_c0_seq1.p1 gnl/MRDRNA2_/MRDRNA2_35310_c0~~gnl/MRDRNA2_/MRDRNA2_35310_c0_seq1.p1  ORF type:complete len:361 (-),score=83.60 gnl/MRDRNA2_/MRDRNA2_35310_c0_seq1:73-1155(-)